jgi:chitinase
MFIGNKKLFIVLLAILMIFTNLFSSNVYAAKSAKADRSAPSAPSNLRAASISESTITLIWNASTDNISVTSYVVYRNNVIIGTTATTSYQINGLTTATKYDFYIKAKDSAGNVSKPSNILSVPTAVPTSTPTPTPTAVPTPTPDPVSSTKIVGYYAAWAAYSGFTPDKIDASKLTHINYAFANIGSDLRITLGYPDVDTTNISKLNALKQTNPNLKTLIAVGGWSWSGRFSDAALTQETRTTFADSCVDFIVKYRFDGIDIDWEYPVAGGLTTNIRRPEDKYNFTLLLQKIREKLDARELVDGKQYLLTFSGAAGSWYINNVQLDILHSYVDYANVMTYDIHGFWDTYTDFNAPLYNSSENSPQLKWSVDSSINAWANAGFPKEKLVMGVPFYGYIFKAVENVNNGLYQTYSGSSSISYANIAGNYLNTPGYTRYFHTEAMVPWLFNGINFITYEDEQSMSLKAQYIKTKGLGGAMIWELSQDPNAVLLNALYHGLE